MRTTFVGLVLLLALIGATPPVSASDDTDCFQNNNAERRIRGCTRLLKATRLARKKKAKVYYNRAYAYDNKGKFDRAIADYTSAVQLYLELTERYTKRGAEFDNKGRYDRANSAYKKATESVRA